MLTFHIGRNRQQICQHVKECGFFTWDRDDNKCYLVKSDYYLEPSDDKLVDGESSISVLISQRLDPLPINQTKDEGLLMPYLEDVHL